MRISLDGETHDEVKTDMDPDTLERQILDPYRNGKAITINGKTIGVDKIERVWISENEEGIEPIIALLKAEDSQSSVAFVGGPGLSWRAASRDTDVTDQLITGPPGQDLKPASQDSSVVLSGQVAEATVSVATPAPSLSLLAETDPPFLLLLRGCGPSAYGSSSGSMPWPEPASPTPTLATLLRRDSVWLVQSLFC